MVGRLLKEPLLQFAMLGALLFVLYGWLHRESAAPREIAVDAQRVAWLSSRFQRTWQRAPTADEMQGLIDGWVREEILVREGLAQGLDREDPVVRQRVLQKMSFAVEAFADRAPTEQELQSWLERHPARYAVEPRYSLEQLYFDPQRHRDRLDSVLAEAKARLGSDPKAAVGDASMLPAHPREQTAGELARTFGDDFARSLATLPTGSWQGPVPSAYGLHLVRIETRVDGGTPALADVRAQVERDLRNELRRDAEEKFYRALRNEYVVKMPVAKPDAR